MSLGTRFLRVGFEYRIDKAADSSAALFLFNAQPSCDHHMKIVHVVWTVLL